MMELAEHQVRRAKLFFLMSAGAVGIMFLVMGVYQLVTFTDSTAFCGRLCHTVMYPEFTVYEASPHSNVTCAECHVGSGADYLVRSKLSGIPLIITTLRGTYEKPIPTPVANLRPARDTCEECHRPEVFFGDVVVTRVTYQQDATNTPKVDQRVLRIGGSEARTGIHWHVASEVWYLPMDESREDIGWVGVVGEDGKVTEYYDMTRLPQITSERIQKEARLMDCIDCHNRATHVFQSPEALIDDAMQQGKIDPTLPFIKKQAMDALGTINPSLDEAYAKVKAIGDFYKTNYPDLYSYRQPAIKAALDQLNRVAELTTFNYMKVSYETYHDNAQHITSPGCMRCHGKLTQSTEGPNQGKSIGEDCTTCHYLTVSVPIPTK